MASDEEVDKSEEDKVEDETKEIDKAKPFSVLAVILIVVFIIISAGIYYFRFLNKTLEESQQLNEPAIQEISEEKVTDEEDVLTEEENIMIKSLVLSRVGISEEDAEFSITIKTEKHAKGNIGTKGEMGGGYWLAAKTEEGWEVVYDGQANPDCETIEPYDFPLDIISECLDEEGNVMER